MTTKKGNCLQMDIVKELYEKIVHFSDVNLSLDEVAVLWIASQATAWRSSVEECCLDCRDRTSD